MVTRLAGCSVKSISGTMPVPVEMITPSGKFSSANRQSTRLGSGRCSWLVRVPPSQATESPLMTRTVMARSLASTSHAGRMPGASAHAPA